MSHPLTAAINFFPQGFTPREEQVEAIRQIDELFGAGKKIVVLEAPTGSGKSFVMQTFARQADAAGQRTFMLTAQKILQDQYERDFPEPEVVTLKGRNAYDCTHDRAQNLKVNEGICVAEGKSILHECVLNNVAIKDVVFNFSAVPTDTICPYWKQVLKAVRNNITMFNFSSFLFQMRINRFKPRDLAVLDEAHNIEATLLSFVDFTIWEADLQHLGMFFPKKLQNSEEVAAWIAGEDIVGRIDKEVENISSLLPTITAKTQLQIRIAQKESLERLKVKLETFEDLRKKTEWIVEMGEKMRYKVMTKQITCRPIYARAFAQDLLFSKASRILCTSATILDVQTWARNLGLDMKQIGFVKIGSSFPKENRLIVRSYQGSMAFAQKDSTLPKMVKWIKNVCLPKHEGQRGIIHAHSFSLAKAIVDGVGSDRLLLHSEGMDKLELLRTHASRSDSVIVAPAMHEGIDLKDDLSRFQVIAKVPYPSTMDKVIGIRMERDAGWYVWITALKLVQCYGRSVRSKDDWATTYVVDSAFEAFIRKNARIIPDWFLEAVV